MSLPANHDLKNGMAVAIELLELALLMRGERHRREHPEATEEEVAAVVQAWKVDRPGSPNGDAIGRSVPWPRPQPAGQ
jgi:Rv0078B-related antitoxin